ncbi:hypothetical protein Dda_5545 [Drechslerella dactyloides]|uniref:Dynamin N-terminal domain-containing protein n=1 Tax=Drechslerella dactyloides TaxID=74499 RepID=A0AAD6NHM9_DREDA|nr:hypothetical protein Dda_5545 [Drechslerella dactyloides]
MSYNDAPIMRVSSEIIFTIFGHLGQTRCLEPSIPYYVSAPLGCPRKRNDTQKNFKYFDAISRTNKKLRSLSLPYLFYCVKLHLEEEQPARDMVLFYLKTPWLLPYIRKLHFVVEIHANIKAKLPISSMEPNLEALMVLIAEFFKQLPRLEILHFIVKSEIVSNALARTFRLEKVGQSAFARVRSLKFSAGSEWMISLCGRDSGLRELENSPGLRLSRRKNVSDIPYVYSVDFATTTETSQTASGYLSRIGDVRAANFVKGIGMLPNAALTKLCIYGKFTDAGLSAFMSHVPLVRFLTIIGEMVPIERAIIIGQQLRHLTVLSIEGCIDEQGELYNGCPVGQEYLWHFAHGIGSLQQMWYAARFFGNIIRDAETLPTASKLLIDPKPSSETFQVSSELTGSEILREYFQQCKTWIGETDSSLAETAELLPRSTYAQAIEQDIRKFESSTIESQGMIGFVGEVGSGKSTLLNSLLDANDLIPTARDGICAPVVIEFAKSLPGAPKYVVEAQFVTQRALEEEARLLWLEMLCGSSGSDRRYQEPGSKEGKATRQRFQHLFPNTNLNSYKVLQKQIEQLYGSRPHLRDGYQALSADSEEECASLLRSLLLSSGDNKSNEPGIWAVVDNVRVNLDARILNSGAILVDIPGLDNPCTRAAITREYIAESQELVVVVPLRKVIAHEPLATLGYEGLNGIDGRARATVVVTFADEFSSGKLNHHFNNDLNFRKTFSAVEKKFQDLQLGQAENQMLQNALNADIISKLQQLKICDDVLEEWLEPQVKSMFFESFGDQQVQLSVFTAGTVGPSPERNLLNSQNSESGGIRQAKNITALQEHIGKMAYPRFHRLAVSRVKESRAILANLRLWAGPESFALSREAKMRLTDTVESASQGIRDDLNSAYDDAYAIIREAMSELRKLTEQCMADSTEYAQTFLANVNESHRSYRDARTVQGSGARNIMLKTLSDSFENQRTFDQLGHMITEDIDKVTESIFQSMRKASSKLRGRLRDRIHDWANLCGVERHYLDKLEKERIKEMM